MRHRVMAALGLFASFVSVHSDRARAAAPDRTEAPRFVIPGGVEGVDRLPLAESIYDVEVSGVVAHARLEQTYVNEGPTTLDAIYVFPMSTRAAVTGLVMRVGTREIMATIKEREAAKAAFETAKAEGRTASLLEQERPNVFRMNVANVRPGEAVVVALEWVEQILPTEGYYELVIPATVAPRYEGGDAIPWTRGSGDPGFSDPESLASPWDVTVRVAAGAPLRWVDSPSHPIVQAADEDDEVTVGLRDVASRGGVDFVLRWAPDGDDVAAGALRYDAPDGESYVLAIVEPPERVEPAHVPAREVVFIVDVSGSMAGFPAATARRLVADILAELGPQDRFDILKFAGGSEAYARASVAATPGHRKAALAFLQDEDGVGGGTELVPALERAFAMPATPGIARTFVIVTDGFITVEAEAFERVRASLGKASVFTFGIGTSVNRHLIEGLARAGRGAPFIVEHEGRAAEVAQDFATYVRSPLVTDIRLAAEGVELADVEPASVPDVYAARPVAIIARLRGGGGEGRVTVTGTTPAGPWRRTVDLGRVRASPRHAALRTLWARERIARLSDFDALGAQRDEVTRLGLAHGLMTAYTSFVAIDDGRPVADVPEAPASGDEGGMGFIGGGLGGGGAMIGSGSNGLGVIGVQGFGGGAGAPDGGPSPALVERRVTLEVRKIRLSVPGGEGALVPLLARRLGAVRQCLSAESAWTGALVVALRIGKDGTVSSTTVTARGLAEASRTCIERVLRRLRLPATAAARSATVTFMVK